MVWSYRVVRGFDFTEAEEPYLTIRSVYDTEKKLKANSKSLAQWSIPPSYPGGRTRKELREDLERMLAALDRPVYVEGSDDSLTREDVYDTKHT